MGFVGACGVWCIATGFSGPNRAGAAIGKWVGWTFADIWWGLLEAWRGAGFIWNAVVHGRWRRASGRVRYPSLYWQIESSEVRELRLRLEREVRAREAGRQARQQERETTQRLRYEAEAQRLARPGSDYHQELLKRVEIKEKQFFTEEEARRLGAPGNWWHELNCSKAPCTCRKTQS